MFNQIRSLETLAQTAIAPGAATEVAERAAGVSEELAAILRAGDQQRLSALLGAESNVCCMVLSAEEDEVDEDAGEINGQLLGQHRSVAAAC